MARLGSFILQSAIAEAQRWNTRVPAAGQPIFVSVNISSRQLFHPDLINEVRHLLAQSKLPKDALRLEITEMLVMENPERATAILKDIAATGAKLSLDDFGAGYSSLVVSDGVSVRHHQGRPRAGACRDARALQGSAVLRSIVALCHELGKTVVAEGTETEEDAGLMRSLGCDHAQGAFTVSPRRARNHSPCSRTCAATTRRAQRRRPVPPEATPDRRRSVQHKATANDKPPVQRRRPRSPARTAARHSGREQHIQRRASARPRTADGHAGRPPNDANLAATDGACQRNNATNAKNAACAPANSRTLANRSQLIASQSRNRPRERTFASHDNWPHRRWSAPNPTPLHSLAAEKSAPGL